MSNRGFWDTLQKPFFVLAPLADVTDVAFRSIVVKYGKPDVVYTEFVSADGLIHSKDNKPLLIDLLYNRDERPIVAQIFSGTPENIERAAQLVVELGFDGLDINMGCPDKTVEKQHSGAALIKNHATAKEIIYAAQRGVQGKIPVSVKTRIGYNNTDEFEKWITALLQTNITALSLHARTRKEMSKVPARWEYIARAVDIRNTLGSDTYIIGNGDVASKKEGEERIQQTKCDGVMVGRGIFGNPWFFAQHTHSISIEERLRVAIEHTRLFEKYLGEYKNMAVMKKHYKAYIEGFYGAKDLRVLCMEAKTYNEIEDILTAFIKKK